ncbi:YobI family P-loop NTPase [Paludibacter jiangxiensis]|uniref:YobI-like P-loop NTPase domain-containing protein n=1 Tax=Paludibacter jiangxiensis TaxID=681398 RepID=A0A161LGN3_9BACT|nr:hypothetical protein [Paludibacter jiangxiensis]GAT64127.1 hypothetical protein PJIAN_4676 [Paludibacter jiangxiensis]
MKNCIIQALNWLLNKLQHQNKVECKDNDESTSNVQKQFDLAATIIQQEDENGEPNKSYQTVWDLAAKLPDPNVSNIALTGPFGSGKSSILKTLKHDFSEYNYLDISLATLEAYKEIPEIEDEEIVGSEKDAEKQLDAQNNQPKGSQPTKTTLDKKKKSEKSIQLDNEASLNRLIEYSILQQLIYKERIQDIPESRFKRIKHIDKCKSFVYSILSIIFIAALCIVLEPKLLYNQFLYNLLAVGTTAKTIWDILALIYIVICGFCIIRWLITNLYNSRLNKINLKDGEIDLAENTSIFNKHLDEIIYFFEVTNYNVVIIEDLDRFATHHIFLKLRELNQLLNRSKAINPDRTRKITFIYAVKDDIFNDSSRTKFFDYIVTVIPIINPSNSCEKLRDSLHKIIPETDSDISDQVCKELGFYIDDMRLLLNIVNEYKQYRYRLADQLEQKKLLAMIIYKNYYPKGFASLHNQKGIVYDAISNKEKYIKSSIASKEKQRDALKAELVKIQTQYQAFSQEELRKYYIFHYSIHHPSIFAFSESYDSSKKHLLAEVAKDPSLFNKLMNNDFQYYWRSNRDFVSLETKFQTIEKEVDPNYTYQQRVSLIPKRVDEINTDIKKLDLSIIEIKSQSLGQILQQYSAEAFFHEVEDSHLISFLLRNGYIDEDYYDYISYFYPGTMTISDKAFVLGANCGRKKEYHYHIHKPEAVIEQLLDASFSTGSMLNIDLVHFLVNTKDQYVQQSSNIVEYVKKGKSFDFIKAYYEQGLDATPFFNELLNSWNKFFMVAIKKQQDQELANLNFEILLKFFPQSKIESYKTEEFKTYISTRFDFISQQPSENSLNNFKFITKELNIKYQNLVLSERLVVECLQYVVDGYFYQLTNDNILAILKAFNPSYEALYSKASYTAIMDSDNVKLWEYVDANITDCLENVFPSTSIHESSTINAEIINNPDIQEETKLYYLSKQENKIDDINDIDEEYWDLALRSNIISPTWNNIALYTFPEDGEIKISVDLIHFIELNNEILALHSIRDYISEKHGKLLFALLINTNQLSLQVYKNIRKAFDQTFNDTDFTQLEEVRVQYLIETKGIEFNLHNYQLIEDHFKNQTIDFILENKSSYFFLIKELDLKPNIALKLLQNDRLTQNERLTIIYTLSIEIVDKQPQLATTVCKILSTQQEIKLSKELVIELLKNSTNQEYKLTLFTQKCITSTYDEEFVVEGLTQLGGDYAKIALQKGKRPKFENNKHNLLLSQFLWKYNFTYEPKIEDDMIRIVSKNIR